MKASLIASISLCFTACAKSPPPQAPRQNVFDPMVQQLHDAQKTADEVPREHKAGIDRAVDQAGQ